MVPDDSPLRRAAETITRRRVVKTGAQLAYAVPLVATTVKLAAQGTLAAVSGGRCGDAGPAETCATFTACAGPTNFVFEIVETPGQGICIDNFPCTTSPCTSSSDCPQNWACVTNTCCGSNRCAPLTCNPGGQPGGGCGGSPCAAQ